MEDGPTEIAEKSVSLLAGQTLLAVRYYDMPFGFVDVPPWDHTSVHAVNYGVDLVLETTTVGITWTQYGEFGYGLSVVDSPVLEVRGNAVQVEHVEHTSPWREVCRDSIAAAHVHSLDASWGHGDPAVPVALTLVFSSGSAIAFVCGGWDGHDKPLFMTGDDIVVLWQPETVPGLVPALAETLLAFP